MTYLERFEENNQYLLKCFSGADGGIIFLNYLHKMRHFAELADSDDEYSIELCKIVKDMASLIKVLNRK